GPVAADQAAAGEGWSGRAHHRGSGHGENEQSTHVAPPVEMPAWTTAPSGWFPAAWPRFRPMQIQGAGALVTGGASGLGEATVRRLTAAGAAVTILDRDVDKGEALAKELGDATRFAYTDVADPGQVEAAVELAA